jgi:hypothetical protein
MASTAGTAELVAALTGGAGIEADAFGAEYKRLVDAQAAQALMTERMQKAAGLERQNVNAAWVQANPIDWRNPEAITPEALTRVLLAGVGGDPKNLTGALRGGQDYWARQELLKAAREQGMTDANALAWMAQSSPELVPGVEMLDRTAVENLYGEPGTQEVNKVISQLNAGYRAGSDESGRTAQDERRIAALMQTINPATGKPFTELEAKQHEYQKEVAWNPKTGRVEWVDTVRGRFGVVPPEDSPLADGFPPAPIGQSLTENVGYSSGLFNSILAAWAIPARWLNIPETQREQLTQRARQQFRANTNMLVQAFLNNPKAPVAEQQFVRRELGLLPEVLDDPVLMLQRMKSLHQNIVRRLSYYDDILSDDGTPPDLYNKYFESKLVLQMFLSEMGDPFAAEAYEKGGGQISGAERLGEAPGG